MFSRLLFVRALGICIVSITSLLLSSCSQPVDSLNPNENSALEEASRIGNGVNLQPSYTNNGNVNLGWSLMNQYGPHKTGNIQTVRLEVDYVNAKKFGVQNQLLANARKWIQDAWTQGYAVIVSYHDFTKLGNDSDAQSLINAADFWKAQYNYLSQNNKYFFTINIMNEWGPHSLTADDFAKQINRALGTIRGSGFKGRIVIDIPGYGQEAKTAYDACKGGGTNINDPMYAQNNYLILSAHIYPGAYNAGAGRYFNTSDIDLLLKTGITCIIGEFGDYAFNSTTKTFYNPNKTFAQNGGTSKWCDWEGVVKYAKGKGCGVLAWSWSGDGAGSYNGHPEFDMNMITGFDITKKTPYFNKMLNIL